MAKSPSSYPEDTPKTVKLTDLPAEMRPREEFVDKGAENVSLEILIAILLRSGTPGTNVLDLARTIIYALGGLEGLLHADQEQLLRLKIKGLGPVKCLELAAALEIGRRAAEQLKRMDFREESPALGTPEAVYELLQPLARGLAQEVFWIILVNTKNRPVVKPIELTRGVLDSTPVHPRDIFRMAHKYNAAGVILAHNHPSGDPTPSPEDVALTRRINEASKIMGTRLIDHIIIGTGTHKNLAYTSLRRENLVNFN